MEEQNEPLLKIAFDELRMQMLGAQVLFGFQFTALFQERFGTDATPYTATASAAGFILIVVTMALLIAGPSLHRLTDQGHATARSMRYASVCAQAALLTLALALGADVFLVTEFQLGTAIANVATVAMLVACAITWFLFGRIFRGETPTRRRLTMSRSQQHSSSLHSRIDYMLTEARVVLPGVQALLGFHFIVIMTKSFDALPGHVQLIHFVGLAFNLAAVLLLISPAAIHRLAFAGEDNERFLRIGSHIVTFALLPFAIGIATDLYIAVFMLFESEQTAVASAAAALLLLVVVWYVVPLALRLQSPHNVQR